MGGFPQSVVPCGVRDIRDYRIRSKEERVRRVVETMLSGGEARHHARDPEYVRDLGLLAPGWIECFTVRRSGEPWIVVRRSIGVVRSNRRIRRSQRVQGRSLGPHARKPARAT